MEKNSQEYRRFAIAYFFVEIYGSPPEEEWPGVITVARVNQCTQLQEQLSLVGLNPEDLAARNSPFPLLHLDGIAWFDEHHRKCQLGVGAASIKIWLANRTMGKFALQKLVESLGRGRKSQL